MKRNKVFDTIMFMTKGEQEAFAALLKDEHKTRHLKLFELIANYRSKQALSIEHLYSEYYDEPYKKDKEYLLRNELRHLARQLTTFLAEKQFKKELGQDKQQLYYLDWLLERGQNELFEIEYRRLLRKFESETPEPALFKQLYHLQERFLQHYQSFSSETFEALLKLSESIQQHNDKYYAEETARNNVLRAYAHRSLIALKPGDDQVELFKSADKGGTLYSNYLMLKAQGYLNHGESKIKLLKQMLDQLPELEGRMDTASETAVVKASIALEYFLLNQDKKALKWYANTLPHLKDLAAPRKLQVIYNYVNALIRNGAHQEAIELMNANEKAIQKSNINDRFYCIRAMCYLLMDKVEEAFDSLPDSFLKYSRTDHLYLRAILSIIYFKRDDLQLALTEVRNAKKVIRQQQENYQVMRDTMSLLVRFYTVWETYALLPEWPEQLQELKEELQQFVHGDNVLQGTNSLPVQWMLQHVSEHLKKA